MVYIKKVIGWIIYPYTWLKTEITFRKKMRELKKKDPFIYKQRGTIVSEFTKGIWTIFKNESLLLALIYTAGHIVISMAIVKTMTGASIWEAGAVALIEPSINGVWFYILHKLWNLYKV